MPYFGYGRQDRRRRAARVPITGKLVANLIATAGIDRVLFGLPSEGADTILPLLDKHTALLG